MAFACDAKQYDFVLEKEQCAQLNRSDVVLAIYHRWHHGTVGTVLDLRSRGRGFDYRLGTRRKYLGKVSYTYVPLSPSSISWYWPKGGDA